MTDFSTATYTPPGVYVTDDSTPSVTPRSVSTTTVTVIGPGRGYQTLTEVLTVYAGSPTNLSQKGAYATAVTGPPAIAAPVVSNMAGTVMTYGSDYTFVVVAGSGGASTATTQIKRLSSDPDDPTQPSPHGLTEGSQVRITYQFTSATYYQPTEFDSLDQITSTYGAALASSAPTDPTATQVVSPITLAARVALENGAASVLCVATDPAAGDYRTQLSAAYAKVVANYKAQIMVPLLVDSTAYNTHTGTQVATLLGDVKAHCESAAADGYGRIAICGLASAYDGSTGFDALAVQIASKRVALAYPNQMLLFNSSVGTSTTVDGFYLAAAMAGRLALNKVNRGLTAQSLTSFTGIPATIAQAMTKTFKDNLSKNGVCVAEITAANALVVRHGLSTDVTGTDTQELSLTRIGDTLLQMCQTGMAASGLVGEPITSEMTMNVKAALTGILEQAVSDETIVSYTPVAVRQVDGNPSVIEATFTYKPAVPANYISIRFSVDLTSGATTTSTSDDTPQ